MRLIFFYIINYCNVVKCNTNLCYTRFLGCEKETEMVLFLFRVGKVDIYTKIK